MSAPKPPRARHDWRVQTDDRGRFDEIVVGHIGLHAEMMDDRSCFVTVAGLAIWVFVKNGVPMISMTEDQRPGASRVDLRDPRLDAPTPKPRKRGKR